MNIEDIDFCLWEVIMTHLDPASRAMLHCCSKQFATNKTRMVHIAVMCAKYGYLDLLQLYYIQDNKVIRKAISNGHIHILEWLHLVNPITENSLLCECNDVETAKWLIGIGLKPYDNVLPASIRKDNLSLLEYFSGYEGMELYYDLLDNAVRYGQVAIAKYLIFKGFDVKPYTLTYVPNLEMLMYLHSIGHQLTEENCVTAAKLGNIEMLEYCYNNGVGLTGRVMFAAAIACEFNSVIWLINHNCPKGDVDCGAAYKGRVDILELLVSKGYTIDPIISINAACGNSANVIEWLLTNGYNINKEKTFRNALEKSSIDVLNMLQKDYKYPTALFADFTTDYLICLKKRGYALDDEILL